MNKEQQRGAARRIMEKLGPMTAEEQQTYEMLTKSPEEYTPPSPDYRKCGQCGQEFKTDGEGTAMQKFSDHVGFHNASPAQWAEAHKRIQRGKQKPEEGS